MAEPAVQARTVDSEVIDLCAELIRFDTTNYGDGRSAGETGAARWVAARLEETGWSPTLLESAPTRGNLVLRVPGTDRSAPAVLLHAHLDVVPADPDEWSTDPFSGELRDGCLWGRGSTDMKDMAAMALAVLRHWGRTGIRPARDVVVAFVADEEDHGLYGAQWLAREHPELFAGCAVAVSETGGYTLHVGDVRLYPVATGERGTLHMKLTAYGRAGHGSRPNDESAIDRLVAALARLEAYRWPVRLVPATRAFLLRTCAALGLRLDLEGDLEAELARVLPALGEAGDLASATIRNSTRATMLQAGSKVNVIPGEASAVLDVRVLPGLEEELLATVDSLLGPYVHREFLTNTGPVEAPVDSPWFEAMAAALTAEDPAAVPVPYCMGGGTDAKAFAELGIDGYGFAPLLLPAGYDYRAMAHGADERVPVEALRFGARVLDRFLRG